MSSGHHPHDLRRLAIERSTYSDNDIFYSVRKTRNVRYTDDLGYYRLICDDHIHFRFQPLKTIGRGGYGECIAAIDHKTNQQVALKLMRRQRHRPDTCYNEIVINQYISKYYENEPINSVVKFFEVFMFRGHVCLVFELLYGDLYQVLRTNPNGLPMSFVKRIMKSTLRGLLRIHDANVIHNDIKPHNIMLRNPDTPKVKVIDFGLSQIGRQQYTSKVQTIFYRSPEVILHMDYGFESDMWSIGCVAAELYTGKVLFPGINCKVLLGRIMEVLGAPPHEMVLNSPIRSRYFVTEEDPQYSSESQSGSYAFTEEYITSLSGMLPGSRSLQSVLNSNEPEFIDFVQRCLAWLPKDRLDVRAALNHPWITGIPLAAEPERSRLKINRYLNLPDTKSF